MTFRRLLVWRLGITGAYFHCPIYALMAAGRAYVPKPFPCVWRFVDVRPGVNILATSRIPQTHKTLE